MYCSYSQYSECSGLEYCSSLQVLRVFRPPVLQYSLYWEYQKYSILREYSAYRASVNTSSPTCPSLPFPSLPFPSLPCPPYFQVVCAVAAAARAASAASAVPRRCLAECATPMSPCTRLSGPTRMCRRPLSSWGRLASLPSRTSAAPSLSTAWSTTGCLARGGRR